MRALLVFSATLIAAGAITGTRGIQSQEAILEDSNPTFRRAWMAAEFPGTLGVSPPYYLTQQERDRVKGTFGVDLSHHIFDIDRNRAKCRAQAGYDEPDCSCTFDPQAASNNGVQFVYLKATQGDYYTDLSFAKNWNILEASHQSKSIFRGAMHFLVPGVDAKKQADKFLRTIGATDGNKPKQMLPMLDIEWTNTPVSEGTQRFDACQRKEQNNDGTWICDEWYQMGSKEIAALATEWIDLVESATGQQVIIYTNVVNWWDKFVGRDGKDLVGKQPFWMSNYTNLKYADRWTKTGGSQRWKMPPLPMTGSYPDDSYSKAHVWQFTDSGIVQPNLFTCSGKSISKQTDMNWVPVTGAEFENLFGVANQ